MHACLRRLVLIVASLAAFAGAAQARGDGVPALPGIGAQDPRHRIDANEPPWRAVGKLQAAGASFVTSCTGTLIGRTTVLTAAHCLYNPRTGRYLPAAFFHFVIGLEGERFAGQALGVRYVIGPGFDPAVAGKTPGADWALLTIDKPLGTPDRVLPLLDHPPAIGAVVMLGGYSQDRRYVLTADSDCRILGFRTDAAGRPLLKHDCAGTRGVSGAPLLIQENGAWRVAGIDVLGERGAAGGYAVLPDAVRQRQR